MKKTERKKESAQTMEEQAAVGKINGSKVRMALLYAFPKTVPIMVGYVFLGMAYGILMSVNGFGVFWAALNSLLVYTGSLEFIGVNFLAAAVSPVTAFVMALMISARHIFYGLSMLGKYQNVSKKLKPYLIFALTDETFSIVCEEEPPETISREWMYFWMSLLDQMYWIVGSVMGAALGNVITFNTKGLDFALTALFVMIFTEQWIGQKRHWPAVTGVAMNSPIQGTAADIIKIAMIRVDQRLRREGLRSRIVLQVHDELLIETWKEELEQVQSILATEMKRAAQLQVELEIDMKMGNSWFETK